MRVVGVSALYSRKIGGVVPSYIKSNLCGCVCGCMWLYVVVCGCMIVCVVVCGCVWLYVVVCGCVCGCE